MQHTLSFEKNKKKYISKPFDFETMCIINDAHNDEKKRGPLNICRDALDYIFEGTEADKKVIDDLTPGERAGLCLELWGFYVDALTSKNS